MEPGSSQAGGVWLVRCARCGAQNRVPEEKLERGLRPRCGRCGAPLAGARAAADREPDRGGVPVAVSDATFAAEVERSPLPVLLDAWAPWCGPCRQLAPVIDALAAELHGRIRVAKLDVDQNPITAERFRIQGIPTLLILDRGREVERLVGLHPRAEILRRLEPLLRSADPG